MVDEVFSSLRNVVVLTLLHRFLFPFRNVFLDGLCVLSDVTLVE